MSDAGSPHMGLDDYRKMGIPNPEAEKPQVEHNPELESELQRRFESDDLVDASAVQMHLENGRIVLQGIAETRYAKERAGNIVSEVTGGPDCENRIRVQPHEETPGPVLTIRDPDLPDEPSTQRS